MNLLSQLVYSYRGKCKENYHCNGYIKIFDPPTSHIKWACIKENYLFRKFSHRRTQVMSSLLWSGFTCRQVFLIRESIYTGDINVYTQKSADKKSAYILKPNFKIDRMTMY